jgi:DNA-directed RNA polymerase subunit RPC12/RpoP
MALINCKECAAEVSSKAETCPKCGARITAKPMGWGIKIVIALTILIVGVLALSYIASFSYQAKQKAITAPSVISEVAEPTPIVPGAQWSYSQHSDDMGKGTIYSASVSSKNTVEFDFPYQGTQQGTLSFRVHPRSGKDIIFNIEKGKILCHSYENCTVNVRFDDEATTNYSAIGAADSSTETIFIRNYDKFIKKISTAKTVRISTNIYHQGTPVFEFDVSDFDQNMLKSYE